VGRSAQHAVTSALASAAATGRERRAGSEGVRGGKDQGFPSWSVAGLWLTIPLMSAAIVTEAPLNLEPVSPDSFIADLEPRSPDAHARITELAQRAAVAPRRRIYD
jgi:hypothetical protein